MKTDWHKKYLSVVSDLLILLNNYYFGKFKSDININVMQIRILYIYFGNMCYVKLTLTAGVKDIQKTSSDAFCEWYVNTKNSIMSLHDIFKVK